MLYQVGQDFGLTIDNLRLRFPTTSFPTTGVITGLAGVMVYEPTPIPSYDALRQTVKEAAPVNGKQQWEIVALPQSQIDANIAGVAASVRSTRNQMLKDTDWTQVLDAPVNRDAWSNYRQALRDITSQQGFPFDINWPVEPK